MNYKNILQVGKVFFILSIFSLFVSIVACHNEDVENKEVIVTKQKIDKVLAEMKLLGESEGKIVTINIGDIRKSDYQNYFKVVDNSKKVAAFATGGNTSKGLTDNYVVTCTWGDGSSKVTKCGSNVGCAGEATWDCLDNGGCATVCNAQVQYIPDFLLDDKSIKLEGISLVFEQAIDISNKSNNIVGFTFAVNGNDVRLNKSVEIKSKEVLKSHHLKQAKSYRVVCSNSDGVILWDGTYNNKLDASIAILDCTDNFGGCAEVCDVVIFAAYVPQLEKLGIDEVENALELLL